MSSCPKRIFRSALEASLAGQDGIEIVGSVFSGQKALEFVQATPPDVGTLDVEMPGMNGLQTLLAIQRLNAPRSPDAAVGVIMVSAHTKRGAEVTMGWKGQALFALFSVAGQTRKGTGERSPRSFVVLPA